MVCKYYVTIHTNNSNYHKKINFTFTVQTHTQTHITHTNSHTYNTHTEHIITISTLCEAYTPYSHNNSCRCRDVGYSRKHSYPFISLAKKGAHLW